MEGEPLSKTNSPSAQCASPEEDADEPQPGRCTLDTRYCMKRENQTRSNWYVNAQSTLALISVAFTSGVIGRAPILTYRHGPSFLLAYIVLLAVFGGPLAYYELSMGQFSSNGILTCWPLPIFKCVGAGILSLNLPTVVVTNTMGAWALYYLHVIAQASINNTPLPWMSRDDVIKSDPGCDDVNLWAEKLDYLKVTPNCSVLSTEEFVAPSVVTEVDGVCWSDDIPWQYRYLGNQEHELPKRYAVSISNKDEMINALLNSTDSPVQHVFPLKQPSGVYFKCHVLKTHKETTEPWEFSTGVTVGSLVTWLLVMLIAAFGIRAIGCVLTVTVPLAFLLFVVLLIRSGTLPGAASGIQYGFIFSYNVGTDMVFNAMGQVMFSLTLSQGILTTYGSYNRFHNNYVRDVVILGSVCVFSYIFGAVMVLGFVGFLSHNLGVSFAEVMDSGYSMIFQTMGAVLSLLPLPKVWCGLFFMMILLMALHTVVALLETFVTALLDQLPTQARKFRPLFVAGFCVVFFLLGLPLCSSTGYNLMTFLEWNIWTYQPLLIILMMIAAYSVYGTMTYFWYRHDVAAMAGWDCCCIKSIGCWMYSTCLVIVLGTLLTLEILGYRLANNVLYPFHPMSQWANIHVKRLLCMYIVPIVLIVAIIQIIVAVVMKKPPLRDLFTRTWRPALRQHENLVDRYRAQNPFSTQNYSRNPARKPTTPAETQPLYPTLPPPYPGEQVELTKYEKDPKGGVA